MGTEHPSIKLKPGNIEAQNTRATAHSSVKVKPRHINHGECEDVHRDIVHRILDELTTGVSFKARSRDK